jgi:hypothetical protein
MGNHPDENQADVGDLDIGALENETIYVPPTNADATGHDEMQMGQGFENDLADPWLRTPEGIVWLEKHGGPTPGAGEG